MNFARSGRGRTSYAKEFIKWKLPDLRIFLQVAWLSAVAGEVSAITLRDWVDSLRNINLSAISS
jgi:hypothetical protein